MFDEAHKECLKSHRECAFSAWNDAAASCAKNWNSLKSFSSYASYTIVTHCFAYMCVIRLMPKKKSSFYTQYSDNDEWWNSRMETFFINIFAKKKNAKNLFLSYKIFSRACYLHANLRMSLWLQRHIFIKFFFLWKAFAAYTNGKNSKLYTSTLFKFNHMPYIANIKSYFRRFEIMCSRDIRSWLQYAAACLFICCNKETQIQVCM